MNLLKQVAFLLLASCCFQVVSADECFGAFSESIEGEFIDKKTRPAFKLSKEFVFTDPNEVKWIVPSKTKVDGASIPPAFWSFTGGPFSGHYFKASVIHDYYCDKKYKTEHDTHRNFYYGMRANGVSEWKAKFMYWAVATFGPKWKLESRVVQRLHCENMGISGKEKCISIPKIIKRTVAVDSVDLEDPEVLAAALSKASSVARTLKTSNGQVLDVLASGKVSADIDTVYKSATSYRTLFSDKRYLQTPEKLGVLSKWEISKLGDVKKWDDDQLPVFQNSMPIKNDNLKAIEQGRQFTLGKKVKRCYAIS